MLKNLSRSIETSIRKGMSTQERWSGDDQGLIGCWERGRQKRVEEPELAAMADRGELVMLAWTGGVEKRQKRKQEEGETQSQKQKRIESENTKYGSLQYLATWQGLRGEDLNISLEQEREIVCSRFGQPVQFSATRPKETESAGVD